MTEYQAKQPYDDGSDEEHKNESERSNRRLIKGIVAAVALTGLIGGAVWGVKTIKDLQRENKNASLEGLLRGQGFDKAGVKIDVTGDTNRLFVSCLPTGTPQEGIEFYLNPAGDAYLKRPPLTDASGDLKLDEGDSFTFALKTPDEIDEFITGFLRAKCTFIADAKH